MGRNFRFLVFMLFFTVLAFGDAKTVLSGGPYYLYKNNILYLGSASLLGKKRKFETDIDGKNYVYMGDELIKDKKNVYYAGQKLKEVKPEEVNTAEDAKKLKKKIIDGLLGVQKQRK